MVRKIDLQDVKWGNKKFKGIEKTSGVTKVQSKMT